MAMSQRESTREETILALYPLVRAIARANWKRLWRLEFDDVVSEGTVGLIKAVDSYDPRRGIPIASYAKVVIFGAMLNAKRRSAGCGERTVRTVYTAERRRFEIAASTGRLPTWPELEREIPNLRAARVRAQTMRIERCEHPEQRPEFLGPRRRVPSRSS